MMQFAFKKRAWALALLTVFVGTTGCRHAEKKAPFPRIPELESARWVEPRLTGASAWTPCREEIAPERVVPRTDCGNAYFSRPDVSQVHEPCKSMITTHAETLTTLITRPLACTDDVIDRLAVLAATEKDPHIASDLSAAYYIRAQRDDRASDLVYSLAAAEEAVRLDPSLPAAQFNLALAQDSLGFSREARATWQKASQTDHSPWSVEAVERAREIDRAEALALATEWRLNRTRLPVAVRANDRDAVHQLVRPFPAAAQRAIEEEILPAWAEAIGHGQSSAARELLLEAQMTASALEHLTGDPYVVESVDRITHAAGSGLASLREGHILLGRARAFDRAHAFAAAAPAYEGAARAFERGGSPMRIGAQLGQAVQSSFITRDKRQFVDSLAKLGSEASRRGYLNLWGRIESNRANLLQTEGRYLDALAEYDKALETFRRMNDVENLTNVHVRKAGIFRVLGHEDSALHEVLIAQRNVSSLQEIRFRHLLAGEIAATVLALGYPETALMYQSALIDALRYELDHGPGDEDTKKGMRINLAIALRARAAIRLHLHDYKTAQEELDEAIGISKQQVDDKVRNALRARIAEVNGDAALLQSRPRDAVAAFSEALELSGPVRYRTFQTILLSKRAAAYRRDGDLPRAKRDLQEAIRELNVEEAEVLAGRRRGEGEGLWADYFSRFQESYFLLIAQLVADGRKEEAFAYAEKSRAFEPLQLVLDLPATPEALHEVFTKIASIKAAGQVRALLPAGTFLLEYEVGEDQTFVWILSHDELEVRLLPVGRTPVVAWCHNLQQDAISYAVPAFEKELVPPYAALMATPLNVIGRMKNSRMAERKLVVIPDRRMHGLPFAALCDSKGHHLVEDFPISTAASATLYLYALGRDRELALVQTAPTALFVGDPAFNRDLDLTRGLNRLPNSATEAKEAGALYGPDTKVLVDKDATAPAFLEYSRSRDIVHVAGHAVLNRHAPFGALLVMAPSKNHSGLLYAEELLGELQLKRARLFVLSACSSAGGMPVGPEGLAPLVRPIVAAGVPGVLGSLWTINDASTKEVLVEFHRHYRNGEDATRALQQAQLHFLRERNGPIPITAWAAFQVVGEASSPYAVHH